MAIIKKKDELKLKNLDFSLIEDIFKELIENKYVISWKDDRNTADILKNKVVLGTIVMNSRDMEIKGKELVDFISNLVEYNKNLLATPVLEDDILDTPIKDLFNNSHLYGGLEKNKEVFKKVVKKLKSMGVEDFKTNVTLKHSNSIFKKLTVIFGAYIDSSHERRRFTNTENENIGTTFKNNFGISDEVINSGSLFKTDCFLLNPLTDEKFTDIEMFGTLIGRYYNERNLIIINFNPFIFNKLSTIKTVMPKGIEVLEDIITTIKAKTCKTSSLADKIFVEQFLSQSKRTLEDKKQTQQMYESNISNKEQDILNDIQNMNMNLNDIASLTKLIENNGKELFSEINKAKKLPFIKSIEPNNGEMEVTFKETCIEIPNFDRGDHHKKFGKRTIYLGEIVVKITPSSFRIYNKDKLCSRAHPHASGNPGSPCFGSGDGKHAIYEALTACRISELMKLLWFWVKTYRNSGAYLKQWDAYDDRLSKGMPVWDEKGVLIELNDPIRIKSKEQNKIDKHSDYEKNIKRFKEIKKIF